MTSIRPRRSVLYMPGSNARALDKAKTLAADALILDLEDAVAPDAKDMARDQVVAAVKAGGYGPREIVIRINGLDTPWGAADLAAAVAAKPDAVLVPKVSAPEALAPIAKALAGADARTRVWAMIETPARHSRHRGNCGGSGRRRRTASPSSSWAPTISPRRRGRGSCPAARRCCRG